MFTMTRKSQFPPIHKSAHSEAHGNVSIKGNEEREKKIIMTNDFLHKIKKKWIKARQTAAMVN